MPRLYSRDSKNSLILALFAKRSEEDKTLKRTLKSLLGYKPKNLDLYKLALSHASFSKESNERLEYLGDAVLGAIIADFLFKKFPYKDEGFLSEIRSRIVKRESLNALSRQIGLDKLLLYNNAVKRMRYNSIYGNALEALIGAIYLDKNYKSAQTFIFDKLLQPYIDIDDIISNNQNFKSILIEWGQKEGKVVCFRLMSEEGVNHNKVFTSMVYLDGEMIGEGAGSSKKKSEQAAAEKACLQLQIK